MMEDRPLQAFPSRAQKSAPNRMDQIQAMPDPFDQMKAHLQDRLMGDYQKDQNPYGSPSNHPGALGKTLHVLSKIGNIAGDVMVPGQMAEIPGTDLHRHLQESGLEKSLQDMLTSQSGNEEKQANTAHMQAETPEIAPNAESLRGFQGAETEHTEAETKALNSPSMIVHDTEAGPLLINPKTGAAQHVDVDGQPVGPKLKLTQSQPIDGPDGKPHTYMLDDKGNKVVDLGVHYERPAVSVNQGEKNLWSVPQSDGSHKVVSLKAGDTIPDGAVSLSGQSTENSKAGAADAPTVAALKFANDYLQSGAFTGPSDEALQDQFFQMAKPSTGFRMNQAQINQLHQMASWMDSWRGRAYHAINGTWFAPEQRRQIVQTMNDLATSKGIDTGASGPQHEGGATPPAGAKIRDYTQVGNGR